MKGTFLLTAGELDRLFEKYPSDKALEVLSELHGVPGLCDALVTSVSEGLDPTNPPLSVREEFFGNNHPHIYTEKSIWHFV